MDYRELMGVQTGDLIVVGTLWLMKTRSPLKDPLRFDIAGMYLGRCRALWPNDKDWGVALLSPRGFRIIPDGNIERVSVVERL